MKKAIRKNLIKKPSGKKADKKVISQPDLVLGYLVDKGTRGATNFEMMMNLHICDVRKCISELNNMVGLEHSIESEYETSPEGKHYKRYWAVPIDYYGDLTEYLNERKRPTKVVRKRTGFGRR